MNKPSQPDTRKGKYDRDGDRLRGAVDSAADLVSGAETTMTESRGAMTAQRERQIKRILRTSGIKIKHSLMEGWLRAMWNDGYALSAHNTAQLQKEVERTKGYDAVLAEVGKLQGIVEAGDAENVELQAALEAKEKELAAWKRLFEMYRSAWLREMGGTIIRKTHEIDGFVLRTAEIYEKSRKWDELQAVAEKRRLNVFHDVPEPK